MTTDTGITSARPAVTRPMSPFLRWAGGKRWLVPEIMKLTAATTINSYHEPFLGGGSVFLALAPIGVARLSDLNTELITVYRRVRDNPTGVAELLQRYENSSDCYYRTRAAQPKTDDELAARFIYLNHTSYNGIYRVNLKGEYNVPYGNRQHTNIPDSESLEKISKRLQGVELHGRSFEISLGDVEEGDLVFLDPPYTVAHNNNGFVKYNQHLFSFEDQKLLAQSIKQISNKGAHFILTNAAHKSIEELFTPLGRRMTVARRNVIGGTKANRGRADEYVFTNIEEQ